MFAVRQEEVGARLAARRGSKMRSDFKAEDRVRMTNIPAGDRTFWRADKVFLSKRPHQRGGEQELVCQVQVGLDGEMSVSGSQTWAGEEGPVLGVS